MLLLLLFSMVWDCVTLLTGKAKSQMVGQLQGTISTMRATGRRDYGQVLGTINQKAGSSSGGNGGGGEEDGQEAEEDPALDVHQLTDKEFLRRQRVRRVFRTLDRNNSGGLDQAELGHLLVLLGLRVAPYELRAVFDYVDADHSGAISFEEFYNW